MKPTWTHESTCKRIIQAEYSNERDYALIEITSPPAKSLPIAWDYEVKPGDQITMFVHNLAKPLLWTQGCTVAQNDTVKDAIEAYRNRGGRLARSFNHTVFPTQLYHRCDTEAGSSGSAILAIAKPDATTGNSEPWKILGIVGVHDFEIAGPQYNGGTLVRAIPH